VAVPLSGRSGGAKASAIRARHPDALEELQIHLVPVFLGGGVRLFGHPGTGPVELEGTRVIESPAVTHLRYRVVR
jgi:hypothetical protein